MAQQHSTTEAWTPLRIAVVAVDVLGVLSWLGCIVWWWRIPDARRDGLELMGLFFATAYVVCLVLPVLGMWLLDRWLGLAAVLALVALVLGSDTLHPWLPW